MYKRTIREADLLLQIKNLRNKVAAFESGEQYQRMREDHRKEIAGMERKIKKIENELADTRALIIKDRNMWFDVFQEVQAETDRQLKKKDRELEKMRERMYKAERERDEMKDKLHEKNIELYETLTKLEEANGTIQALTAKMNKDYTNSSKSSSMSPDHKKIQNSREKTNRKPGGQPGHVHHGRKQLKPTQSIEIPALKEYTSGKGYYPTGRTIRKQLIELHVTTEVIEYFTSEYFCTGTGKTVHAPFPAGFKDDVNYDGTVKAFAYMINNGCYVSIDKSRAFLEEISKGKISLSKGMVSKLSREFSEKTNAEREEIYLKLFSTPVMNVDFTFGRVNGKQGTVIICASDGLVLYQGKEKKGHEGVKGSPVEFYQGTIVSDHESTFSNYGSKHQECLAHVERYLLSSVENEPDREWNARMLAWVKKAIHSRNEAVKNGNAAMDDAEIAKLEKEYDEIIEKAKEEYEYVPASEYFKEGFNLYKRMAEDKQDYVLFLHDLAVPPTNNAAESYARKFKRKSAQVMCFRSENGRDLFCDGLTIMESMKSTGENVFEGLTRRFNQTNGAE